MHSLKSEKGNAIIGAVLIGGLALLGLQVMVSQVSNFSQELGKSEAAAKGGEELNTVLQVLTNKFRYHLVPNPNTVLGDNEGEDLTICDPAHPEQCKPEWAPDYSISPDSNMPPYIMSLLPSTTETPFVANKLVLGFKDTNGKDRKSTRLNSSHT